MLIIKLIIRLIKNHVPIEDVEISRIQNEAETWYENIPFPDEPEQIAKYKKLNHGKEPTKFLMWLKQVGDVWYIKLLASLLYIKMNRVFYEYMNPGVDDDEDED